MAQSASRAAARARPAKDRSTLYEEITNKIIAGPGGWAPALGAAVGFIGRARTARDAEEWCHRSGI